MVDAPFRPSVHGCRFGNAQTDRTPIQVGRLRVARVTGGLCGGMALASLHNWRVGDPPPGTDRASMARIFAAQLRSFDIPTAPMRYLALQRPGAQRSRSRATAAAELTLVDALRRGEPTPVALVCALSRSPWALVEHHIVLAYDLIAHDSIGSTFAIYDPNYQGADDVRLTLSKDGYRHSRGRRVYAAFVLRAR